VLRMPHSGLPFLRKRGDQMERADEEEEIGKRKKKEKGRNFLSLLPHFFIL